MENLKEILSYKDDHPEAILLRGNHDMQQLGYESIEISSYFLGVAREIEQLKDDFLAKSQWIHVMGNTVFSHAGIWQAWLEANCLTLDVINSLEPSEWFGFNTSDPYDFYVNSPEQPPTWIRPMELINEMIPDYDQVAGHTSVDHCFNVKHVIADTPYNLWLCDALDQGAYFAYRIRRNHRTKH